MANDLKRHLMTLVKAAVTIGLIAWVVRMIDWQDQLRLPDGATVRGRFVAAAAHEPDVRGWLDDGKVLHPVPLPPANAKEVDPAFKPGFLTVLKSVSKKRLLLAFVLLPLTGLILAVRWRWLLQTHGLDPGLREVLRLTWIGLFSNNVLPSSIGGDAVKAVCIARRAPAQRVDAAMTVLVDRALGLVSLLAVGGCAVAFGGLPWFPDPNGPPSKLWMLPWAVFGGMLSILGGAFVFFSGRFRALLKLPQLLARLPGGRRLAQLDGAVFHFRSHTGAMAKTMALSLALHLLSVTLVWIIAGALGMQAKLHHCFMFVPLIFVGSAFLPSIGGLGVQESAFVFFFTLPFVGDTASQAVALSLLYRMLMVLITLPGGLLLQREMSHLRHPEAAAPAPAGA